MKYPVFRTLLCSSILVFSFHYGLAANFSALPDTPNWGINTTLRNNFTPEPDCLQFVTLGQLPGVGAEYSLPATDLLDGDAFDAGGNLITDYSIYREEGLPANFVPQTGDTFLPITCDDLGQTVNARVYAIAADGSFGFCTVQVEISLFFLDCEMPMQVVAGTITQPDGLPLAGVQVELFTGNNLSAVTTTNASGAYFFTGLAGAEYTIHPVLDRPVDLDRVTITDVVLLGNLILAREPLSSNYTYLAADVDLDGVLTIGDMVAIQRVILGLDDRFTTNLSWHFVAKSAANTFPFNASLPQTITVVAGSAEARNADFVGFGYGDTNLRN